MHPSSAGRPGPARASLFFACIRAVPDDPARRGAENMRTQLRHSAAPPRGGRMLERFPRAAQPRWRHASERQRTGQFGVWNVCPHSPHFARCRLAALLPPRPCTCRSSAAARHAAAQARNRAGRTRPCSAIRAARAGRATRLRVRRNARGLLPPPEAASAPAALLPGSRSGGTSTSGRGGRPPLSPRVLAARRPPGVGAAGERAVFPQPALALSGHKLRRAHGALFCLWRPAPHPAAAVLGGISARARRLAARLRAVLGAGAFRREVPAALPALLDAVPGRLGPAARVVRALARQVEGVLFGVGVVPAVGIEGEREPAPFAARLRAVHPAGSGRPVGLEPPAAHAALDGLAERPERTARDRVPAPVPSCPALLGAVAEDAARRLERAAALAALGRPVVGGAPRRAVVSAPVSGLLAPLGAVQDGAAARREPVPALLALGRQRAGGALGGLFRAPRAVDRQAAAPAPHKCAAAQAACDPGPRGGLSRQRGWAGAEGYKLR